MAWEEMSVLDVMGAVLFLMVFRSVKWISHI